MAGNYARKKKPELAWTFWAEEGYRPKKPEESPLFQVVQENLETFLAEAELRAGGMEGVPRFDDVCPPPRTTADERASIDERGGEGACTFT